MSETKLKLPFKRFVAQVSTGTPRSKSTYLALMAENLSALMACPWRESGDVPVALTGHDFTASSYFSDAFDAYKMTGNYNSSAMTEVAYAGMAAYRFTIPTSAASVAIDSIVLPVTRDRFLKSGLRVSAVLSDSDTPSTDWDVVRGTDGIVAIAQLAQSAANLLAGSAADGSITFTAADYPDLAATGNAYLWIYVTLEDYTDAWDMYSATEKRLYAVEGSAMIVGESAETTFAGDVVADASTELILLSGGASPTWLQPLTTVNVGTSAPAVPSEPLVETFFSARRSTRSNRESSCATSFVAYDGSTKPITINFTGRAISSISGVSGTWTRGSDTYWTYSGSSGVTNVIQFITVTVAFSDNDDPEYATLTGRVSSYCLNGSGRYVGSSGTVDIGAASPVVLQVFAYDYFYFMLQLSDGEPEAFDKCDDADVSTRRELAASISVTTAGVKWSLSLDGVSGYTLVNNSGEYKLSRNSTTYLSGTSQYGGQSSFFDPAVALRLNNADVDKYGLSAVAGDFSAAIATFEAGTQPSQSEMLGRLVRLSKGSSGGMMYLHPASGALADELDALRPVPRFYRASQAPAQTECQPGLSVWYKRPATGSTVASALAYRDGGVVAAVKVSNPAFLQYAFLALRAPTDASLKGISLRNVGTAVPNGFRLRFVAWKSSGAQWDGSSSFALAAVGSAPSLYWSEGPDAVAWRVDCNGSLMPMGERTVTAERIGRSPIVSGDIAAETEIVIPVQCEIADGDVVFIVPEVLGFADGVGAASVYFGRQANPNENDHDYAWARYATDKGWYPRVELISQ